jgi:hypothetical protein
MNVIPCGASVIVGDDIDAIVTGILIRRERVLYECSWWNGREHKCEYLEECEVLSKNTELVAIGFHSRPSENPVRDSGRDGSWVVHYPPGELSTAKALLKELGSTGDVPESVKQTVGRLNSRDGAGMWSIGRISAGLAEQLLNETTPRAQYSCFLYESR